MDKITDQNNKDIFSFIESLNEHKFFGIMINKLNNISSEKIKLKIIEIIKILNSTNIDFLHLKKIIFEGLPDDVPSLRSLSWKMMLNYLPLNLQEWENYIDKKRIEYVQLKDKIFTKLELDKQKYAINKNYKKDRIINPLKSVEVLDLGNLYNDFFVLIE